MDGDADRSQLMPLGRRAALWGFACASAALFGWSPGAGAQTSPSADALAATLTREAPDLMRRYNVPGVAVAILTKDAPPRLLNFGVGDRDAGGPVDDETAFQVGSISKFVTAIGVMRLVEAGVIGLDAPVSGYLRRWRLPASGFGTDEVTARTILSHSAGLSVHGYFPGSIYPGPVPSLLESVSGVASPGEAVRVVSRPGTRYSYSGGGYSVLQIALEDETETPFDPLFRRLLFQPLGLRRTAFSYEAAVGRDTARPHDQGGRPMPVRVLPNAAAAGLTTTARDLAFLTQAALAPSAGREGLLSPTASALIATPMAPAAETPPAPGLTQTAVAPETIGDPSAVRYGPGATVALRGDGRRIVGHTGSNAGWKALVQYAPQSGDGIVILTNGESGLGVILPLTCRWRQWLDARAGAPATTSCPEHAASYIAATFARDGQAAAVSALRQAAAGPAERWLFSDRTAADSASALKDLAGLRADGAAEAAAAAASALAAENARLFPASGFAQAQWALDLAANGRADEARQALGRARELKANETDTERLIAAALSALGESPARSGHP